ncbi:MAG: anhydro-N-acetylmuramic acid kinase [Alphaproteobacteria bacterium]|jgi:anhydro-N-acetylmuramic acid kinase
MLALGLMSGTSMDGIDAALLRTDGVDRVEPLGVLHFPYDDAMRGAIRGAIAAPDDAAITGAVECALTDRHADIVAHLLADNDVDAAALDVVGFHGQTILHDPAHGVTRQIGDGARLARLTGCRVVNDFRSADMAAGGEGAPLAPVFHAALGQSLDLPVCVLNVGGVANVTWIGAATDGGSGLDGGGVFDRLLAFDTGPGGALIDDWVLTHTGAAFDEGGALAAQGTADAAALACLLEHAYFAAPPPKSLDRNDFDAGPVAGLAPADGAATLLAFTVESVVRARDLLPGTPKRWLVTGGGRHNATLMAALRWRLDAPVDPVEAVGWDGDALEAQAFAYLAVRRLRGLPASGPTTTGASGLVIGGVVNEPGAAAVPA